VYLEPCRLFSHFLTEVFCASEAHGLTISAKMYSWQALMKATMVWSLGLSAGKAEGRTSAFQACAGKANRQERAAKRCCGCVAERRSVHRTWSTETTTTTAPARNLANLQATWTALQIRCLLGSEWLTFLWLAKLHWAPTNPIATVYWSSYWF
jgi:hypothetical protein